MFYSITFARIRERTALQEMMETWKYPWVGGMRLAGPSDNFQPPGDRREKINREFFTEKIWRLKKILTFAAAIPKRCREFFEIYIIQQVVQVLGKLIFRIDTVKKKYDFGLQ